MKGSHLSFERFTPTSSTSSICCIWQPVCNKWIFTVISKYICLFLTTLKLFFYIYSNSFTYLTFCEGSFHIFSSFLSSWMSFCFLLMSRNMYDYYKYPERKRNLHRVTQPRSSRMRVTNKSSVVNSVLLTTTLYWP